MELLRENYIVQKENGLYSVTTKNEGASHIYWSQSPSGFTDDNDLGEFEGEIKFKDPAQGVRLYFHIICGNKYYVAALRSVEAGGMVNLRDLGGYNTADGESFVKYGLLFRGDMLKLCGEENMHKLEALKLKSVVDFRSEGNIARWKDYDPPVYGASYELLSVYNDESYEFDVTDKISEGREAARAAYNIIANSYKTVMFDSDAYRKFFRYLLDERTPILFHCYAGKDRTGIGAALILLALGVPRETIIYDYMLTAEKRKNFKDKLLEKYSDMADDEESKKWFTFFSVVIRESIENTLAAIDERYPNTEDYFINELDLTKDELIRLRELYLSRH